MESRIASSGSYVAGRTQITLAEHEMPGLMTMRRQFGSEKPLVGARISGSLHMTVQTAVLIETLQYLGAELRWCSCNVFSTQDDAAAAVVDKKAATVFAWKGETVEEYWQCILDALTWPDGGGPDIIVDDGGDATLLIHKGYEAENNYRNNKQLPSAPPDASPDEIAMTELLAKCLQQDSTMWHNMAERCKGVSEETTTGVQRLSRMAKSGELLFPAINVNDCVTKSKFDNVYGCRHSLPDGIMRATDVMIGGKKVVICGYGEVGKGCAAAMRGCGAVVYVTEIDPICALQAAMEGYSVVRLSDVLHLADIFITATGNCDVIMKADMEKMKNNAIVGNIGHFDNELDMQGLINDSAIRREFVKDQVDRFVFPDDHGVLVLSEGRLLNLGCATGHPSFVMSCSFTNQTLAQIHLWKHRTDEKYEKQLYLLPKELDESVARLHLPHLGCKLTKLTQKQSDYISVNIDGPYKLDSYRY